MHFTREPFRLRSGGRTAPRLSFSPKLSGSLSIIIELSRAFCCFCPNSQARKAQDAIHPDEVVEPLRDLIALTTKGLTDRILVQFEKDKIQSAITMFRLCPSASDYFTSFPDELHKTCRIRCFKNRADYKSTCVIHLLCVIVRVSGLYLRGDSFFLNHQRSKVRDVEALRAPMKRSAKFTLRE